MDVPESVTTVPLGMRTARKPAVERNQLQRGANRGRRGE
jgi:hypothetical protein